MAIDLDAVETWCNIIDGRFRQRSLPIYDEDVDYALNQLRALIARLRLIEPLVAASVELRKAEQGQIAGNKTILAALKAQRAAVDAVIAAGE